MGVKFVHFAGIDVSKDKIDVSILVDGNGSQPIHSCFKQSRKGFNDLKKWIVSLVSTKQLNQLVVCVENTGLYHEAIVYYLDGKNIAVCVENAAHISRSIRDNRLKNDEEDSRHIARYAKNHVEELKLWVKPRTVVTELKQLLAQRKRLMEARKMLKMIKGEKQAYSWSKDQVKAPEYQAGIKGLDKDIANINKYIQQLVKADKELSRLTRLITSIPSVGLITACYMICYTNEFQTVVSGKQLASYCGVVPFARSSGSSVRKKARVSHMANRTLKSLLHLCALTATKMKNAFGLYYQRKKAEGKHSMSAINSLRNKLALTIAAVVRSNKPFEKDFIYQTSTNLEKP